MSDTADPTEPFKADLEANAPTGASATPLPAFAGTFAPAGASRLKAASGTSELTRLVCAVSIALTLGGACGLWLHYRLALSHDNRPASARALPDARRAGSPMVRSLLSAEPTHGVHTDSPTPPAAATPAPRADEPLSAELLGAGPSLTAGEGRGEKRAAVRGEEAKDAGGAQQPLSAPVRKEARPSSVASNPGAARGSGRIGPCAIYASAGSLTVRPGGSAPLIIGGPGGRGPFTVTTPHWSDIAVFSEGAAGAGKNGWTKYTVKSVSKRAGLYTLHVKSPCDSQTVRVRVTPQ